MDAVPTDPLARFVYRQLPSSVQNQPEFLFIVDTTHLIPRCDPATLWQLLNPELAPFPLKEQSGFFYTAQCAHYGLAERKTKDVAKKTLLIAFDQQRGTLRVPSHILAREKEVKKEYEKEVKKAEAAAKKAEAEEKKRMDKIEEMSRVRQKALADLAKVNAFEKKLIGTAAGSSRPKAAGAASASKKTTASVTKKTTTITSAAAAKKAVAPTKKVTTTTSSTARSAADRPSPDPLLRVNTYTSSFLSAPREPRPYASTEIYQDHYQDYIPQPRAPVAKTKQTARKSGPSSIATSTLATAASSSTDCDPQPRAPVARTKQTARRSRPLSSNTATVASSSAGRIKVKPAVAPRARPVKTQAPDTKPRAKQETKPDIHHDHYERYETHVKPEREEHEPFANVHVSWDMHDELDEDYDYY